MIFESLFEKRNILRRRLLADSPRRLSFESLETRNVLAVGLGFHGIDSTDTATGNPPDPMAAIGDSKIVQVVNNAIAIFDKATGQPIVGGDVTPLTTFFNKVGTEFGVPGMLINTSDSEIVDPVVIYNEVTDRFVVGAWDRTVNASGDFSASRFDFAISKTTNPTALTAAHWDFFRYNTDDNPLAPDPEQGPNLNVSDYPKIGYNADGFIVSFNMYRVVPNAPDPFVHVAVLGIKNDGSAGGIRTVPNAGGDFTFAPASHHDATPSSPETPKPMWFVQDGNNGDAGTDIEVIRLNNPFSNAPVDVTRFPIDVTDYAKTPQTFEPQGSVIQDTRIGTRFYFSGLRTTEDGVTHLVAAHAIGIQQNPNVPIDPSTPEKLDQTASAAVRWYDIQLTSGVSGTPSLLQEGTTNPNPLTTDAYLPGIDIREDGTIGLSYVQSGLNEYMSMYVTTRAPFDPQNPQPMQYPILVKGSTALLAGSGTSGDYSFLSVDPVDGSFWAVNEMSIGLPNWGTWIQNFTPTDGLRVMNVTVSSSTAVQALHPPHHYAVNNLLGPQAGSGQQLQTVPVGGADTLSIQFSTGVVNNAALAGALGVIGLETGLRPTVTFVDYISNTRTATWRLSNWTAHDQYLIRLDDAVTDLAGNHLDGEWVNPRQLFVSGSSGPYYSSASISKFPSGNGAAGGDFNFLVTLLHGDRNLNNSVGFTTDINPAIASIGMGPGMNWFDGDFTGNGMVGFTTDINPALENLEEGWNFQVVFIAGDFDDDGDVDMDDFNMFTYPLASGANHADGDTDGDGDVDDDDDAIFSSQWAFGVLIVLA